MRLSFLAIALSLFVMGCQPAPSPQLPKPLPEPEVVKPEPKPEVKPEPPKTEEKKTEVIKREERNEIRPGHPVRDKVREIVPPRLRLRSDEEVIMDKVISTEVIEKRVEVQQPKMLE